MSEEKQRRIDAVAGKGAWGAVFCWTGIYLLRLLIGLAAAAVIVGIFLTSRLSYATPSAAAWSPFVGLLMLALVIAMVSFLPLWRGLEKVNIRGFANTVAATGKLLVPAILLQLFVPLRGEIDLGIANFFVAVGVCYLVTLAQDFDRRSQFVALLIAGGQAIFLCLASMILDPDAPIDRWQVKTAVWLGAVPPVVLMVILFFRCSGIRQENRRIAVDPLIDAGQEAPVIGTKTGELPLTELMAPAPAPNAEGGYFYVGPDNEPVGPISWAVLLQLRRSGTIADETFVAREGESDWGPLKHRLAELESSAT